MGSFACDDGTVSFDYTALRRSPDVEAENLYAHDATDVLLVERALEIAEQRGLDGSEIVAIGDNYGALTLPLAAAGLSGLRVSQDLVTGRMALANNARALGLEGSSAAHELDEACVRGAKLVLVQLPKSLAELEEIADAIARWAASDCTVVAGGRVKHMTLAMNEVLAMFFARVQPQRAEHKSRLVIAEQPLPASASPPFPTHAHHPEFGLTLCAHGGVFAGDRVDIGARTLVDAMRALTVPDAAGDELRVVDLGCGTGVLAAAFALRYPSAQITATDRSAAAVRSARATMRANGLENRVEVTLDDAGSTLPSGAADLVLLNPPFHLGATVHEGAGRRLIEAAARLLRPGGEVWAVFNSHLDHRRALAASVGATEQVLRTPKFTVTRSIRSGGSNEAS